MSVLPCTIALDLLTTAVPARVAARAALIAGYDRWRHRLAPFTLRLSKVSATILIALGQGFIAT